MVQPHHNFVPKFMTRNKIFFYHFIYFGKIFGKMPNTNPFILTVKKGFKALKGFRLSHLTRVRTPGYSR